jgi:hypothetical protein
VATLVKTMRATEPAERHQKSRGGPKSTAHDLVVAVPCAERSEPAGKFGFAERDEGREAPR